MRTFLKDVYRIWKLNGISLFLFELIYRVATSAVIIRLTDWFISISLKQQKYSYLTAENFVKFICHPLTLILLAVILLCMAFAVLLEISAVFWCIQCSMLNEKTYVPGIIKNGITNSFLFIRHHPVFWSVYMLGTMPFLGLHFIIWEIANVKILEFTAIQIYKVFPVTWLLVLLCVIIVAGSVIITFSLPYCITENRRIRLGIKLAAVRLKRHLGKSVAGVVLMQILVLAVTAAAYLIAVALIVGVIVIFMKPSFRISGVLTYGNGAKSIIGLCAGSAGIIFGLLAVGGIYFPRRGKQYLKRISQKNRGKYRVFRRRSAAYLVTSLLIAAEAGGILYVNLARGNVNNMVLSSFSVTAHRGGALMAPENTMSAMEYAVASMSDYAEIDVQETKDDILVLLHDNNLKRTTGLNANVWDMAYQEVAQLDAGVKFNKRFLGEKVPTLDEIIKYSKGKIRLNIEVKSNGHNKNIVSKVIKCIEDNDFEDQCILTSMNYGFLKQAKELNPDIKTGYIMTMTYGSIRDIECADLFSVKHTYVTRWFVKEAHACGKEVHAWTVNYPGDIQRMITYGADGVITDDPALVHRIYLGEEDKKTGFWGLMKYAVK